jgi:hypothetical protein
MTNSFSALKKSRGEQLEKLQSEVAKLNPNNAEVDANLWKPVIGKDGNAFAKIRFLPAPPNEDVPFVRYWRHGFKGPKGWYIERSRTSIGEKDPMTEYNQELWATDEKSKKDYVSKTSKRKLVYVSNILVLKHAARPEDEGKVFKFNYGKKIFDMLQDKMHPQFEDEKGFNPFDFWEGANFNLRMRTVDKFPNYDKSTFDEPDVLMGLSDEELEAIWKQEHSLQAELDPGKYKSYEDLQKRVNLVFGLGGNPPARPTTASRPSNDGSDDMPEDVPMSESMDIPQEDTSESDFFARLKDKD